MSVQPDLVYHTSLQQTLQQRTAAHDKDVFPVLLFQITDVIAGVAVNKCKSVASSCFQSSRKHIGFQFTVRLLGACRMLLRNVIGFTTHDHRSYTLPEVL